ncbi:MAG: DUF4093 domain-containing protein [Ruminococcaceae bacterium]|nr:DUF4093 domain-containing protein [Oscillospiraceae bacterium]
MIKLKETIVVEGKYDKIKLSSIFDANIIDIGGFKVFKNKENIELLKRIAEKKGIIILTDSDSSGFKIRNYLKSCLAGKKVYNVYIPDIKGKEKRKDKPSSEGLLGVEGMEKEIIIQAFEKSGVFNNKTDFSKDKKITKADLYRAGLYGKENSKEKRMEFLKKNNLPQKLSSNSLIEILNSLGINL